MDFPVAAAARRQPWPSLWAVALVSLLAQLALCQFFSFGARVPVSIDVNPSNLWKYAYHFPPRGEFLVLNWFGVANLPSPLNPFSFAAAHFSAWFFFTTYAPLLATCALLAMVAFLRELDFSRPAALVGGVIYAWQGDLLPFVFPGHYAYIATWPFYALAAWAVLRAQRTRQEAHAVIDGGMRAQQVSLTKRLIALFREWKECTASFAQFRKKITDSWDVWRKELITQLHDEWEQVRSFAKLRLKAASIWKAFCLRPKRHYAYVLIAGASCGLMVGLQPDRGAIASLLIAALYIGPACIGRAPWGANLRQLTLCAGVALLVSLAAFLALFQGNIVGVTLGGTANREESFKLSTQYSLGPADTLTYLVPGFFGWYNGNQTGPYWGWIGQTPGWEKTHEGTRNENLAISTTGTVASILAVLGICLLLPGVRRFFGIEVPSNTGTDPTLPKPGGPSASGQKGFKAMKTHTLPDRQLVFGRILLIVGGATLILSWGYHTPLYRLLFALPLMDKWRNPLKWLEIFNFAAVVLAAFGAQQLFCSLAEESLRRAITLFFAVVNGVLFVLLLASYPLAIVVAANLSEGGGYTPEGVGAVMHTLHVALGFALFIGLLTWLAVAGAWHGDRLQQWRIINPWLRRLWHAALSVEHRPVTLAVCLAALVALQMDWVATKFIQPTELTNLTVSNPLLDSLRSEGPTVRVAVPEPQDPLLNTFLQYQFAADRISSIDISAASRIPDALAHFVGALNGNPARLWLLGGVKNVAIGEQDLTTLRQNPAIATNMAGADGYTLRPVPDDQPTHVLVRLRDYLAKATFIPRAEMLTKDNDTPKRVADPAWNPRDSVLLTTIAPGAALGNLPEASTALARPLFAPVEVLTYTPHEIRLRVSAPSAGYVLINDQYDPDWQVEINGKPADLLRADYLLRAVAVDAGISTINLRYEAHYRVAGFALPTIVANDFSDAVMLLAWLIAAIALGRGRASRA